MSPSPSDETPRLRAIAHRARRTIELVHTPAALWPYVSNSDMLNQRSGLGPLRLSIEPREEGAPLVTATGSLGPIEYSFVERPHTFVAPTMLDVDRPFLKGPIAMMGISIELSAKPIGGTTATIEVRWVDRDPSQPAEPLMQEHANKYATEILRIDSVLASEHGGLPFAPFLADKSALGGEIERLSAQFSRLSRSESVARALAEFVLLAPDAYVGRIRPFEVATFYGLPPLEMLELCLRAVRDGLLDMCWDVLCPSCRDSSTGPSHLVDLEAAGHCGLCGIDFGAGFDENVEVRFYPVQKVRSFERAFFCAGPPAAKPHIVAQIVVEALSSRSFDLDLPIGSYDLRDEARGLACVTRVRVEPDGAKELRLRLGDAPSSEEPLRLAPHATLHLENPKQSFETIRFETLPHREGAATAALVTSLQIFRDLFSSEVLRPGVQLGVSNVTVLFSDLKDSTVLYERRGDAPAFALVQDHFTIMTDVIRRYCGGVVKTIGDAVMAVFQDAGNAVRASFAILDAFAVWNATHPPEQLIVIKLGLHRGPCLALNLNDKLDYFGQTVNKAARIQGQSVGNDLVLSRELFDSPDVQAALHEQKPFEASTFATELKGITGRAELVRLMQKNGSA